MNPITIQNSDDILDFLAEVSLRGKGFTTDCLLDYVLDEGFTEPIYLNASGEDPEAFYKNEPQAWAIYQIREWKRVLTVSGGPEKNDGCRSLKPLGRPSQCDASGSVRDRLLPANDRGPMRFRRNVDTHSSTYL